MVDVNKKKTSAFSDNRDKAGQKTDNRGRFEENMLMAELILCSLILIVRSCSSMEQGDKEEIKKVLNIIIRRRKRGNGLRRQGRK